MIRLCIMGNSHTGCIKQAWDREVARAFPGIAITFFASRAGALRDLRREGTRLVMDRPEIRREMMLSSGGLSEIELTQYDAVLFVGLGMGAVHLTDLFKLHRLAEHDDGTGRHTLVSTEFLRGIAQRMIRRALPIRLADKIREVVDLPLFMLPDPLPRANMPVAEHPPWGERAVREYALDLYLELSGALAAGERPIPIFYQPDETITDRCFTRDELSRGASGDEVWARQETIRPDTDVHHMNAAYGAIVLTQALTGISAAMAPEAKRVARG